ncbi:MAG: hypothetical protein GTO63_00150, partial [Anaerolineae bacterium]|nr:hypothetical protein [Anaerolineae bacterium]NIN93417.1 hypothetical protein [Anaerolineae bacterium]
RGATRVNELIGDEIAQATVLDVAQRQAVVELLEEQGVDAFVSAVPYFHNLELTRAAIQARVGMTDLGGNSDVVLAQLEHSEKAVEAGISVVP